MLNKDYKEMLRILLDNEVKFLVVGAYAMGVYGYPLFLSGKSELK